MKCLLILCLTVGLAIVNTHQSSATATRAITNIHQTAEAQLQLSTSILEERYSEGSRYLHLLLNLTYLNTGNRPILLDKKSSLVYRKLVSKTLKAASQNKYVYDARSSIISVEGMRAVGMRMDSPPEIEAFVTINPGESYNLKAEVILYLYNGTKDTEDSLHPGRYFLQVKVATWFYFADVDEYREKWRDEGYLWSKNIMSVPMPFTVKQIL